MALSRSPSPPEVLAPAGSLESLRAALRAGADAVYFGLQDGFNARARASNFSLATLRETVAEIHRAGARAYVTFNTLLFEPELEHAERALRQVAESGVDALIVQDPAVCMIARALCPELELHASTQMTVSDAHAAEFARELGISRVVVPRELSVDEIGQFAKSTELELEVFIHGALCVSWSGQCLTSEAWGGRSANRGQCAQSCRMPYDLVVDGERIELDDLKYLLSPRDLAGAHAVPALMAHGVRCLKIEGRQKGPAYVATATRGYRRWVDAITADAVDLPAAERQLARDLLDMSLAYTRGFSPGFFDGSDHQRLVDGRFPKHRGVLVGTVLQIAARMVWVREAEPDAEPHGAAIEPLELRSGMGVVFDAGQPERDEPGGPIFAIERDPRGLRLSFGEPGPDLARVHVGDRVWATSDPAMSAAVERELRGAEPTGRVALSLRVAGRLGEPLRVSAEAAGHTVTEHSETPLERARGRGLDADLLRDKLGAFGGTPFRLESLDAADLEPGLHLAPPLLKVLRRALVDGLLPQLERGHSRQVERRSVFAAVRDELTVDDTGETPASLVPLVRDPAQLEACIALGVPAIELDWMEYVGLGKAVARARAAGLHVAIATPRIAKPGEEQLVDRIWQLAPDAVLVRNWSALTRLRARRGDAPSPTRHGDFSLNVTNSLTARHLLRSGLATVTAAHDLDDAQLVALAARLPRARLAVTAHHRIATFHTEHCVYSHLLSEGRDFRSCGRPCERHAVALRDHRNREHPVIVDVGCRNTVFHHAPQQSSLLVPRLLELGVTRFRLEFVRESADEVARVIGAWRDLFARRATPADIARRTRAEPHFGVSSQPMQIATES